MRSYMSNENYEKAGENLAVSRKCSTFAADFAR